MRLEKHEIDKIYQRELDLSVWEWNFFKGIEQKKFRDLSLKQYLKALDLAKLKPNKWVNKIDKAEKEIWLAERKRNKWKK